MDLNCLNGYKETDARKIYIMKHLFAAHVRKIYIMERAMHAFLQRRKRKLKNSTGGNVVRSAEIFTRDRMVLSTFLASFSVHKYSQN